MSIERDLLIASGHITPGTSRGQHSAPSRSAPQAPAPAPLLVAQAPKAGEPASKRPKLRLHLTRPADQSKITWQSRRDAAQGSPATGQAAAAQPPAMAAQPPDTAAAAATGSKSRSQYVEVAEGGTAMNDGADKADADFTSGK